jgi:teichuronic acid biosynthesis glycosyltransferase TuaG
MSELVSVIVPSYNRFDSLLKTLESIKSQTYINLEIIVINDCSDDERYHTHDFENNVTVIHLLEGSKTVVGYGSSGYVRNVGLKRATGFYIAFCDDDDIWFPNKLEMQINALKNSEHKMCCTDGLIGMGEFQESESYKRYNKEHYYKRIKQIHLNKNSTLMENGFPDVWDREFILVHNSIITSSVILEKSIVEKVGEMSFAKRAQDWNYWLRSLRFTSCIYLDSPLIYFDNNHTVIYNKKNSV